MLVWICLLLGFDCVLRFVLLGDLWYGISLIWFGFVICCLLDFGFVVWVFGILWVMHLVAC